MIAKEAIETLKANYPDACYEQLREAVDAAIEALKAQDAVGDTIYRQAAIDAILHLTNQDSVRGQYEFVKKHGLEETWSGGIVDAIDAVIALPSAQPEPLKITIDHAPTADELEKIKQAMRNTPVMLLPSEQPEIIKCRDCRKYRKLNCPFGITVVDAPDPDGYCYKAERRTDESD